MEWVFTSLVFSPFLLGIFIGEYYRVQSCAFLSKEHEYENDLSFWLFYYWRPKAHFTIEGLKLRKRAIVFPILGFAVSSILGLITITIGSTISN